MTGPPDWIAVGLVTRAHGVNGEVAVRPLSQVESRFEPGATVFLGEDPSRPLLVTASRPHRDRVLVTFDRIEDRTKAEALGGEYLFVPASWAPPLPEGEYWSHQLVGSTVVTEAGIPIGVLAEILHTQANDVWVVTGREGEEILIPALKDLVASVDVHARRITVREEWARDRDDQ